jgi:hypothetical protein
VAQYESQGSLRISAGHAVLARLVAQAATFPLDIRMDVKCVWSYNFAGKRRRFKKDTASKRIPQP